MNLWKVVYVNSRAERKVEARLKEKGIECYVPLKKEIRQWSDRRKTMLLPLINGYVFIKPTVLQRDEVLAQQGVIQYVRYNGADALIREEEINVLRSIESKGYFAEGKFGIDLTIGDSALVKYGPFKGLRGVVKSTTTEDIYTIAIESINYSLTLFVPKEILVKD